MLHGDTGAYIRSDGSRVDFKTLGRPLHSWMKQKEGRGVTLVERSLYQRQDSYRRTVTRVRFFIQDLCLPDIPSFTGSTCSNSLKFLNETAVTNRLTRKIKVNQLGDWLIPGAGHNMGDQGHSAEAMVDKPGTISNFGG